VHHPHDDAAGAISTCALAARAAKKFDHGHMVRCDGRANAVINEAIMVSLWRDWAGRPPPAQWLRSAAAASS
jgi:hypothetical protein